MAKGAEAHDCGFNELNVPEPETRTEQVDKMFDDAKKEVRSPLRKALERLLGGEK